MTTICCAKADGVNEATVASFDLNRYMGLWYEIARFDSSFERGMTNVTAEYTLRENGTVRVDNSGERDGKRTHAIGKAKAAKPAVPGSLRVSFFLWFYAPYRVLMLGENYEYALVSSGEKYLWILSRTPKLEQSTLNKILAEAQRRGFDTNKLIFNQ